jgi:hypothetical protein
MESYVARSRALAGTVRTLEPVKTCLFDLGHIFESSTAIDSLEIGVGLKMVFCRSAMRRLVSTALVLFCTPKPAFKIDRFEMTKRLSATFLAYLVLFFGDKRLQFRTGQCLCDQSNPEHSSTTP